MGKNNTDEVSEEKKETSKENATGPTTIKTEYEFSESAKRLFEAARQPTPKKEPAITFLQDDEGLDGEDPDPNNLFDKSKLNESTKENPKEESSQDLKLRLTKAKDSATVYVGLVDIIMQQLYGFLNRYNVKRKMGKAAYQEAMVEFNHIEKGFKTLDQLDIPEQAKIRIITRMQKRIDDLPLTDNEYEICENALVEILKDLPGFELSPKWALSFAAFNIMLPRTIEIFED